jgi:hypothetical protein
VELCATVSVCQLDGGSGHHDIPAHSRAPFDTWGVSGPQLRECIVDCKLPQPGLHFDWVHLRSLRTCLPTLGVSGIHLARLSWPALTSRVTAQHLHTSL